MAEFAPLELPVITLREAVMFPRAVMTFPVGRQASVNAISSAASEYAGSIFLVTQKDSAAERPLPGDLYPVGVVCRIRKADRAQDGTIRLLCEGLYRASWLELNASSPFGDRSFPRLRTVRLEESAAEDPELPAVIEAVHDALLEHGRSQHRIPQEQLAAFARITDAGELSDAVAPALKAGFPEKQAILEILDKGARLRRVYELLGGEIVSSSLEKSVKKRVKEQMEQNQKEYYLTEQIKAIHKELGHNDIQAELIELEEKLKAKNMPADARDKAIREVHKMQQMQPATSEYVVARNYVDWIIDLPWNELKKIDIDLDKARRELDGRHYGLDTVKTRVLEYLAVQKLSGGLRGPILCLVGPPGVGKTSLARSIADATGRDFVRISLGGVRDEAEIRGHRRTYIGALPGKIIMALKRSGTNNPLFCLDEIDKMTVDFRGDPASALLEVLDPEQNRAFNDHYLDMDYDLSQVFFITTANDRQNIPAPLLDRMEVIELSSYLENEKMHIAREFLLPRQWSQHGLEASNMDLSDEALREVIRSYTRESGVRELERQVAALCRKTAVSVVESGSRETCVSIAEPDLEKMLGVKKFRYDEREKKPLSGVVAGLAYTGSGGDLLYIETLLMPGTGKIQVTGKLGDVMKESAQAAFSWIRSQSARLGLKADFHKSVDIHIHVPEGAVPKDGPSAGITLATSLASALLGIPVRDDICMTGEITLRGRVLPIGGLREKLMAACRSGMKTVLIPAENEKDLREVPDQVKEALEIRLVESASEVLPLALLASEEEIYRGGAQNSLPGSLRAAPSETADPSGAIL